MGTSFGGVAVDTPSAASPATGQTAPRTVSEVLKFYADPKVAAMTLARARWGDEVECLRCGSRQKHIYISTRKIWKCKACRKQFSPKAGTILEDSPIGLDRWLAAIWLIANNRTRVSAYRLHRLLGVTRTTAQFMLRRIHMALAAREIGAG